MLAPAFANTQHEIAVIKTIASQKEGIKKLLEKIIEHQQHLQSSDKKYWLLAEKAYHLIQQKRMKDIDKKQLKEQLEKTGENNLYRFIEKF
jgi:LAO/AO transport system kinase